MIEDRNILLYITVRNDFKLGGNIMKDTTTKTTYSYNELKNMLDGTTYESGTYNGYDSIVIPHINIVRNNMFNNAVIRFNKDGTKKDSWLSFLPYFDSGSCIHHDGKMMDRNSNIAEAIMHMVFEDKEEYEYWVLL